VSYKNFRRKWIKLWCDECLTGTIREDLRPDERSVWYDFLLLAGRNRPPGCVSANEDTPLSPPRLAAILNIPQPLLERAVKKFEESGRIERDLRGIIHIVNWAKYQFSDYDRQKPWRQKRSILERNRQYLEEHPEEVLAEPGDEYMTPEEIEQDRKELARGDTPLEVHEKAMLEANPHLADGLPE
jgi:hypothetical protein